MPAKPSEVFYVEVLNGTGQKNLRHGQRGGGLMGTLRTARDRMKNIGHQGVQTQLWRGTVTWELVDESTLED